MWHSITEPRVLAALRLSFGAAALAAAVNVPLGLLVAWVMVRYRFPGRNLADALIDMPLALPTAVAGIALTALFAPKGWIGALLAPLGIKVAYTPLGILVALIFVGLPFVVRTLEPVIMDLPLDAEEAAATLGATRAQTLRRVVLPALLPALLAGFGAALARGVGEYGSVIFIAGNMPMVSEIAPLLIVIRLEQLDYAGAAALGLVMLLVSFGILLLLNLLHGADRHGRRGMSRPPTPCRDPAAPTSERRVDPGRAASRVDRRAAGRSLLLLPLVAVVFRRGAAPRGLGPRSTRWRSPDALAAIRLTLLVAAISVPLNAVCGVAAAWCIGRFRFPRPQPADHADRTAVLGLAGDLRPGLGAAVRRQRLVRARCSTAPACASSSPCPAWSWRPMFVTFPFVARTLIPLMQQQGAGRGGSRDHPRRHGLADFRRVTLPNIRWGLLYGVLLCNARAMGEFGAVAVVSGHIRGQTMTMPLQVEALFNDYDWVGAFTIAGAAVAAGAADAGC